MDFVWLLDLMEGIIDLLLLCLAVSVLLSILVRGG